MGMLRSGKLDVPNKYGKKEVGKDLPVLFEDLPTPQISFSPGLWSPKAQGYSTKLTLVLKKCG